VFQAVKDFDIDLERSFVLGDLQMDIDLGKAVGCKTLLVSNSASVGDINSAKPDAVVPDLLEAARTILHWQSAALPSE
jgi:histidinol phosphatase-like enzyme